MTSAAGQLALRGGHPAIDFVNTVAWRGDSSRRIDHLDDYADLTAWCRHAGLLTTTEARDVPVDDATAHRVLTHAKRLREALHALWTVGTHVDPVIGQTYIAAMRRRQLGLEGDVVTWTEPGLTVRTPLDRIAIQAVALMTEAPLARIKRCDDDACGWLFLDTSHRQNRRWCSAADCGNRDRARRHYERSRR
ncbi:CGNR zinc finger domain-containing protein [Mycobacterium sp. MMS18-G62]